MSDTYQPIYDAVRSKIVSCDIGSVIGDVFRSISFEHHFQCAMQEVVYENTRPSVVFKPTLVKDGSAWIACLGANIQEGVVGCGDSPDAAMRDFDKAWYKKEPKP